MKNILALGLLSLIIACGQSGNGEDLATLKKNLSDKKSQLKELEAEITSLTEKIHAAEPAREVPATPVEVLTVNSSSFERYVEVQGRVEADELVNVSSEVGGRIIKLYAKEGDFVRKGQLLVNTDLETIEKQIDELENKLKLAATVFERQKRLWDQNIGSEIQYLEAKTQKDGLEKSLETLKSQLKKKNIYAPISGYVDHKFLKEGEMASPGMPILQVLNTASIKVVADVQEHFLKSIHRGDSVSVRFPALGLEIDETITMIGRTINLNNRTFEIEINTSSRNGQLKPNLLSVIRFKDYQADDILTIPLDAIHEEVSGKKYVYVLKEEGDKQIARKSYIKLGESNVNEVIITSGITGGDLLITRGSKGISEGDFIKANL